MTYHSELEDYGDGTVNKPTKPCRLCDATNHFANKCLILESISGRLEHVSMKRLCLNCLRVGHNASM